MKTLRNKRIKALAFPADNYSIIDFSDLLTSLNHEVSVSDFLDDNGGEPSGNKEIISYNELMNLTSKKDADFLFSKFEDYEVEIEIRQNVSKKKFEILFQDNDVMYMTSSKTLYLVC